MSDIRASLVRRCAEWVLSHRKTVVAMALLGVLAAAAGLANLGFSMEYRDFFGGGDPRVAEFDALQRSYSKSDNVLLVIAPASQDVFNRRVLGAVSWLTEHSWTLPYASRVDSLTNFQHSSGSEDDIAVSELAQDGASLDDAAVERIRRIALEDVLLVDRIVSRRGHVTGINVNFRLPDVDKASEIKEVMTATRALAAELERSYPDLKVYLSGTLTISHAFFEVTVHDLQTLIPLMFIVLVAVLGITMRSVLGAAAAFGIVGASAMTAFGIAGWLGMTLTPPAAAAAPIIMTLAIADCIHLFATYMNQLASGRDRHSAMVESIVSNFGAVTITSVTTAIGFATMNLADSPPFHDLGNLVVLGVLAAYVLALTLFSTVVTALPITARATANPMLRVMDLYSGFAVRHRWKLLTAGLCLFAIPSVFVLRNELNDEFLKYFDESVPFRRDNDFITRELTGVYQFQYSLRAAGREGVVEPRYLEVLDRFGEWFRQQPEVWHVESLADLLKRINQNVHADDPLSYRLPMTRAAAAQSLLLLEMSLRAGLDLNDRITVDRSASRMTVGVRTIPARELIALEERADRWLQEHAPRYMRALPTGPAVLFAHMGMNSIYTGLAQELVALVLISLLMLAALRSIRLGLVTLVPNVVPAAASFGVWGLLYGHINMALATVAGMALGIVVDDTIHFMSKYLHARRTYGASPEIAVRYAITEVGGAVVATSLTLMAGFLALTPSPFLLNWGMGALTALTIFFAMLFDLTMLPGLLIAIDKVRKHEGIELAVSRT
jgi:predicted RND superfamily exporter protein